MLITCVGRTVLITAVRCFVCVGSAIPIAVSHGSRVLPVQSQSPCFARMCWQHSCEHLLLWLACVGHYHQSCLLALLPCVSGAIPIARDVVCVGWHYNQNCFLALLLCVGSAVAIASLHCLHVLPLQSQSSCIVCVSWQCHPTSLCPWFACVASVVRVASVHGSRVDTIISLHCLLALVELSLIGTFLARI